MCFSATANFVGGGIVAGVGLATLSQIDRPGQVVLGSLPLAFGVHQVLEGFVWLGLEGRAPLGIGHGAAAAYLVYAQALLPLLGPLAVLGVLPAERRRRMLPFVVGGVALGAYLGWTLWHYPWTVVIAGGSLDYRNPGVSGALIAAFYVVLTVGPFLVSGRRWLVAFGVLNLVGLLTVLAVKAAAFTSVWCAYAAVVSLVLFGFLRRERRRRRAQGPHGADATALQPFT